MKNVQILFFLIMTSRLFDFSLNKLNGDQKDFATKGLLQKRKLCA